LGRSWRVSEEESSRCCERHITNRWTGAAVARFASTLVRRRLNEIAPPGQLKRWVLTELTIVDSLEATIRGWQQSGLTLLPPNSEASVHAALNATGRNYSGDVVALYCTTGGMADDQFDSRCWSLWSLDRIVSENSRYQRSYLLFSDFLIDSHLYCFKYENPERSAVCIDYFNGQEPRIVSKSVSEFFDLYVRDSDSLELFH